MQSSTCSDDDDVFSAQCASTSATSRSPSPRARTSPEWSKGVRWLVPRDVDVARNEQPPPRPRPRPRPGTRHRPRPDRMSALWEEEEDLDDAPARPRTTPKRPRPAPAPAPRTVSLPTPLPVSSGAAGPSTGYTALTLPRAAYAPAKHPARLSSSVDLTRSGLAQTTMSTIAVARRPHGGDTPARLRAALPCPLRFSSHTPPPAKVHSSEVLVQVWAVGLDALDALLLAQRAARSDGLGHVPGRSFVGRAVECGWDVNTVSKGEWVLGITHVRKSGALAEYIVLDRRRLHRAPSPSPSLSLPQLALLPLVGIPAHRAVRTLSHLPAGSRALVLHAHDGAGLLATQALSALGCRVTAQVPCAWGSTGEMRARTAGAKDVRCGDAVEVVRDVRGEVFEGVVDPLGGKGVWEACRTVLKSAGQFTTLVGDAETALPTPNAHFKSNMRSLRRAFVKTDHKSVGYQWVSPAADVDSGGEDVRDSLAAVVRLAVDGVMLPHVGEAEAKVLPFERAPEAFEVDPGTGRCMLFRGGTAVVRLVE